MGDYVSPVSGDGIQKNMSAVRSLTGIRGYTALWVMLNHLQIPSAKLLNLPWLAHSVLFANGYRGVDLFFILSGFILMRAHGTDFIKLEWPSVYRFGLARFFRIYPLNTLILVLMVPLVLLEPGFVAFSRSYAGPEGAYKIHNLSGPGFVQSLLLVQTFTVAKLGEWNGPSWSLSAELLGYLMFPIMAWLLMRQRSAALCNLGATMCLAILTALMVLLHHADNNATGMFGAVRMIFCFTAGMLCCRAVEVRGSIGPRMGSALTMIAIGFLALTMVLPKLTILDIFGFALLIVGLVEQAGPVNAILESQPLMWLGSISFSFYMIQETLFRIFLWAFEPGLEKTPLVFHWFVLGSVILGFLMIAWVLFIFVEKPFHRLGRRVSALDRRVVRVSRLSALPP